MYESIHEVRRANLRARHHFFDADTMRFFRSRILPGLIAGRFFITSEQFVGSSGVADPRRFTIREALSSGEIVTANDTFQKYASAREARIAAKRLAEVDYSEQVTA
jgi:hypothetical protein